MGDTWIPPPSHKLYSVSELQALFAGQRLLILGDSTARQAAMTLFALLNHTTTTTTSGNDHDTVHVPSAVLERDVNLNRNRMTEPCNRPWWKPRRKALANALLQPRQAICRCTSTTTPPSDVTFLRANCLQDVSTFLASELAHHHHAHHHGSGGRILPHYTLLVLNLGIWHQVQPQHCDAAASGAAVAVSSQHPNTTTTTNRNITTLVQEVHSLIRQVLSVQPSPLHVVWQTSGYALGTSSAEEQPAVQEFNRAVLHHVEHKQQQQQQPHQWHEPASNPGISYVNFAAAIQPKSFDLDRIRGDHPAHYGLAGRLVWIQLLAHHWDNLQQQQQFQSNRME